MSVVLLMLPDLSLVLIGWLLSRSPTWARPFWDGLERLVYHVLFPCLLFLSVWRAPLAFGQSMPAIISVVVAGGVGMLAAGLAGRVLTPDPRRLASGAQCAYRFNTYVALALAQRLGGDEGIALCALLVGIMVPLCNVAAVVALSRHAGGNVAREIARNPLIIATLLGLTANLAGWQFPEPMVATLGRLSSAALATGLLTVGAGLVFGSAGGRRESADLPLSLWITGVKLVLTPAVAMLLVWLLKADPLSQRIAVMFAAMPTASSCYILAVRLGGDGPYVARLVSLSMLTALLTLPFWLSWLI